MLFIYYVFPLILIKFHCHNDFNLNLLSKWQINNNEVIRYKHRILFESDTSKTNKFDELKNNYKPLFDAYEISENFYKKINEKKNEKKKINKNKGNFNVFPLFLSQSVDSKLSLNEQDEKDKQDKKGEQEDLITQKFDHYTIITNSQQLLNDITVDASDISKLSINNLSIPYNESTKTLFSHQRHIVLTNNGKKKYKVELMTKNPNFISTSAQTLHEADFIEKERNFEDSLNQNTNLYDGIGDLYYGNDHASENKEKYNSINESDNHNGSKEINNNNIGGVLKKVLNFLSFKSYFYNDNNPSNEKINENKSKEEDANKESNNLNNDNNDENTKENNNENSNKKKMASIGKLVDQYLLNLKNENSTKQELILVFKGELDLNSPHMKNFILEAKNKLESYIKENFKDINEISYEIVTPINFVCFFVPNIFNMNNYDLLKEALSIVYNDLKEYTENWSFSSSYVVDNVDDINEEEHIDKKKREKKYKKKKKRLYNVKYSFLRKILSFNQLLSFSSKNKNKEVDIEKEILSFLPKELRDYSTWNLSIIRVFNAWMLAGYGNKNIKVCIIDSGVDLKHVDLTKNLFVPKYDKRYMMTKEFYDFMVKNPKDSSGHGTHVTGIIGGSINDLGVVGVAPNVTLISLRFIDGKKYGGSLQAIKALNVCILNKAPIINASWGSNVYDSNLHLAVERLKNTFNGKGSVFIAAAGNKAKNNDINPMYPANYKIPHGLSVASISRNLEISVFSNYGVRSVHIMAPGHKIYSTVPNDSYKVSTGTSMATPHVCGVSALIYSVCYNQGFIPQAEDVLDIIIRTAIKIESKERKTIHNSLINAEAAVLTTLLGGLWMQMDCHFVKFFLDQKKKRHIPIVFSAYKKGIYETDIVIAVMSTDKASNAYGEIHIPVKIVTDSKFPSFKESPKFGKNYVVDASEAEHDEILSYICENAIFNMHEYNYTLYFILLIVLLILAFILLFVASIYFRKKIHKQKEGEKNNFLNDQKILNNHMDTRQEKNEENTLGYKKNSFNIINRKKEENNQNENIYFFQEIKQPLLERRETKIDNGNCVNENGNLDMFVDGE